MDYCNTHCSVSDFQHVLEARVFVSTSVFDSSALLCWYLPPTTQSLALFTVLFQDPSTMCRYPFLLDYAATTTLAAGSRTLMRASSKVLARPPASPLVACAWISHSQAASTPIRLESTFTTWKRAHVDGVPGCSQASASRGVWSTLRSRETPQDCRYGQAQQSTGEGNSSAIQHTSPCDFTPRQLQVRTTPGSGSGVLCP
ncbi:hypothetical protein L226DRAFT_169849 [Lentinus tigrinus ALCF2SS1-7]|uniref:uncharacterized protein n=1 Tax=Lentinus tigrinus ALCF2SS1-7 TaxID=1328758 RepID=UPI001165CD6E|nr:hypothetical protein L226DRAFT_169849 [Lentinus tigrinus ALCF2SS1-7]